MFSSRGGTFSHYAAILWLVKEDPTYVFPILHRPIHALGIEPRLGFPKHVSHTKFHNPKKALTNK